MLLIIVKVQNKIEEIEFNKKNKLFRKNKYQIMHKTLFKYIKKRMITECSQNKKKTGKKERCDS